MKPSNSMKRYLELARKEAIDSAFYMRHGAVLVKGGSVLNKSCNNPNYSSFMKRFVEKKEIDFPKATRHAELMCVLGLDKSVTKGATIYVVRINNNGDFRLSKPCDLCVSALEFVEVRKVIYSIDDGQIGCIKF